MKILAGYNYLLGVLFSMMAMVVTLTVSVVTYPIYWKILPRAEFVAWFSTFEFSQLFLLLDVGFTQSFIRKCSGAKLAVTENAFGVLRGTMLVVAFFAFAVQLPAFAFTAAPDSVSSALPYIGLAIATAVTIWSYAETAALRVLLDFRAIYTINMVSNAIFLCVAYFGQESGLFALAGACLIRAIFQNLAQLLILSRKMRIATVYRLRFDGVGSSLLMNSAYSITFCFDAVIFNKMGINAGDVSIYMLNRKIFDVFRGAADAAMNVVAVRLATSRPIHLANIAAVMIFFGMALSFVLARPTLELLFEQNVFQLQLSLVLALIAAIASIFRFSQIWLFMADHVGPLSWLSLAVIVAKIAAISALAVFGESIQVFYLVQAGCMAPVLIWFFRRVRLQAGFEHRERASGDHSSTAFESRF